jgi:fido (protein-threonine AMPylation protein)
VPLAWNDDPPGSEDQILENCAALLADIIDAAPAREEPTVGMAQDWHRRIYDGITLPVPYYAGEVRDSDDDFPELIGYEVEVGAIRGVPSAEVPQQLAAFAQSVQQAVAGLDAAVPAGQKPSDNAELRAVLTLCTVLHGEWVRIHPFANGNGRVARVWVNWAAVRYSLPPFVDIKPRPGVPAYALAAVSGMRGEHTTALTGFAEMLNDRMRNRLYP